MTPRVVSTKTDLLGTLCDEISWVLISFFRMSKSVEEEVGKNTVAQGVLRWARKKQTKRRKRTLYMAKISFASIGD